MAVVADGPLDLAGLAAAVEDGLGRAGVMNPVATVREIGSIPRHPPTGKARRFIPLEAC